MAAALPKASNTPLEATAALSGTAITRLRTGTIAQPPPKPKKPPIKPTPTNKIIAKPKRLTLYLTSVFTDIS